MKDEYIVTIPMQVEQQYSNDLGAFFYDDIIKCNPNLNGNQSYRESDIQFIKFLFECGVLVAQPQGGYICQSFCKKGERLPDSIPFYKVINFLAYSYIVKTYKDLDLEDEVYDHGSIVRPKDVFMIGKTKGALSNIYQIDQMSAHAVKWNLSFASTTAMTGYYTSRAKLYCQYVLLRRIAILYRDTPIKEPLYRFYEYLNRCKENGKETINLRVEAVQLSHQNWATGLHEWLMCALFESALYRTAGLADDGQPPVATFNKSSCIRQVNGWVKNTRAEGEPRITVQPFAFHEFNWLDYQFLIRSRYEHIINPLNLEGHIRAINVEPFPLTSEGWLARFPLAAGGSGLDGPLTQLFTQASTPYELIWNTYRFYHSNVLHDETPRYGQYIQRAGYTATGQCTIGYVPTLNQYFINTDGIEIFKKELRRTHDDFKIWLRDLWVQHRLTHLPDKGTLEANYAQDQILPIELQIELRDAGNITPTEDQRNTINLSFK